MVDFDCVTESPCRWFRVFRAQHEHLTPTGMTQSTFGMVGGTQVSAPAVLGVTNSFRIIRSHWSDLALLHEVASTGTGAIRRRRGYGRGRRGFAATRHGREES
jgi:hypothetical protein